MIAEHSSLSLIEEVYFSSFSLCESRTFLFGFLPYGEVVRSLGRGGLEREFLCANLLIWAVYGGSSLRCHPLLFLYVCCSPMVRYRHSDRTSEGKGHYRCLPQIRIHVRPGYVACIHQPRKSLQVFIELGRVLAHPLEYEFQGVVTCHPQIPSWYAQFSQFESTLILVFNMAEGPQFSVPGKCMYFESTRCRVLGGVGGVGPVLLDEDASSSKRKITLRVGEERIIFKSVKPASSLIKRIYMLSLRERIKLDLEARLMGETLVLNRSLDPFFEDYIELNDLNVPLELRRDHVDDLMPTMKEGEVIEEFRARNDARMVSKFFGYPSYCDHDKKTRIYCSHNLKFSCMIDFAVLEDMDAYHDEGMGDVIFGKPFLREVEINAKRFKGMITIYNGNEETAPYLDTFYRFDETQEQKNETRRTNSALWDSKRLEVKQ
ncbi:hypothetical protein Tco_0006715 [Tanacetum coccineum]